VACLSINWSYLWRHWDQSSLRLLIDVQLGATDENIDTVAHQALQDLLDAAEQPDICVIDINLPTVSGFELARRILARVPSARIIMFSMNDDPVFAARAIDIGAKGYVSKTGDPMDLVEAIRLVGKGETYLPPAMARSIAFAGPAFAQSPLSKLTSREMEILRLLGAGKSLSEIAWLVHSSYKTVANTSSIMRQKLGVRSSVELVRLAIESGVA